MNCTCQNTNQPCNICNKNYTIHNLHQQLQSIASNSNNQLQNWYANALANVGITEKIKLEIEVHACLNEMVEKILNPLHDNTTMEASEVLEKLAKMIKMKAFI